MKKFTVLQKLYIAFENSKVEFSSADVLTHYENMKDKKEDYVNCYCLFLEKKADKIKEKCDSLFPVVVPSKDKFSFILKAETESALQEKIKQASSNLLRS